MEAVSKPWDVLFVDLIGQYLFTPKGGGKKYQMTTKKGKNSLFTCNHYDGLDRNLYSTLCLCRSSI